MKTVALKIGGIHCSGCADTIKALLATETGVSTVDVSFDSKTACVLYDPALTGTDSLIAAMARAGFTATAATRAANA